MYRVEFTDKAGVERYTTYGSLAQATLGSFSYFKMGMTNIDVFKN